ncbi:pyridoxal phosphate-dependent decarboxylase [Mycena albidolilacea]|uniref:Pyridoxal phosphate-dependent decarboxylase n=1 Tax=Mycena albidolilacea TaxID=1033008 RepID=A0AAD7EAS2_9AGAR|nr:pyridoxal phosphate-dependent decarboxylase [Mycena albidolilacea]
MASRPVVAQVEPGYLRKLLPCTIPEDGENFQEIVDDYQKFIIPGLTNWQHPSFFGYFPVACTWEGIIGDIYAGSLFNPGFNWICSPACTELEVIVMDWAAKMFGLSENFQHSGCGGGVLQATASDSLLVAMVAARVRYVEEFPQINPSNFVIYVSSETHSLGLKNGRILGIEVRILNVEITDDFALRGNTVRKAIQEDLANGKIPFFLVATVGTTSTGAVDRIDELGAIAREYFIWLHIDAAWAGVALACPEFRNLCQLDAINDFADSFCTNFHKWGLVNWDASTLWVRNKKHVTNALDVTPAYLRPIARENVMIEMRNWKIGLGSHFRALKVWFVFRSYGVKGFQAHIRDDVALNVLFASKIMLSPILSLVSPPSLALSVFRIALPLPNLRLDQLNKLNKCWYRRLASRADIFVTHTEVGGIYCVRFAIGGQQTQAQHVLRAFEIIEQEAFAAVAGGL